MSFPISRRVELLEAITADEHGDTDVRGVTPRVCARLEHGRQRVSALEMPSWNLALGQAGSPWG